jgi:hypothetical protein
MSRLSTALPVTLALAASIVFATSCGSSGATHARFVHAIQDSAAIDIDVNGTVKFPDVSFLGVSPSQPGYTTVPGDGVTIAGLVAGTTTPVFSDTATLSTGGQYTLVATGFSQGGTNGSNVVLISASDNNGAPPSGDVKFRVIHASPSGPGSVDVYVLLNPATVPTGTPTVSALAYEQASTYVALPNNPNNDTNPPGFTVFVTASGSLVPIITEAINPATGAIRTLVLTDVQNGTTMNTSFLELSDLN